VVPFLASAVRLSQFRWHDSATPAAEKTSNGVISLVPNIAQLKNFTTPFCIQTNQSFCGPLFFGGMIPPTNCLTPRTGCWTCNGNQKTIWWCVSRTSEITVSTRSFLSRFNQALVATPSNPVNGQIIRWGYSVPGVAAENTQSLTRDSRPGTLRCEFRSLVSIRTCSTTKRKGCPIITHCSFNVTKRVSHGLTVFGSIPGRTV